MGRPKKPNKVAMTTISVEEAFIETLRRKKQHNQSWTSFLRKMFRDWEGTGELRKENEWLLEILEQHRKTIAEHVSIHPDLSKEKVFIEAS